MIPLQVMQDYSFCMKTENNQDDEGTLPWIAGILNFDWASREASKIKKQGNFEKVSSQKELRHPLLGEEIQNN